MLIFALVVFAASLLMFLYLSGTIPGPSLRVGEATGFGLLITSIVLVILSGVMSIVLLVQ